MSQCLTEKVGPQCDGQRENWFRAILLVENCIGQHVHEDIAQLNIRNQRIQLFELISHQLHPRPWQLTAKYLLDDIHQCEVPLKKAFGQLIGLYQKLRLALVRFEVFDERGRQSMKRTAPRTKLSD